MQRDLRTIRVVETTRCNHNDKPYRNAVQKAKARKDAHWQNGTAVAYTERSYHDRCICGKQLKDQCSRGSAEARNLRVKRLKVNYR